MKSSFNRRTFLAGASSVVVWGGPTQAREIKGERPWVPQQADLPNPNPSSDYLYFTPEEVAFVDAATERLIPEDELGPGARACGVTLFIDHQLAGAFGRAEGWYMSGPWEKGQDTQGFQSRLTPAALYRTAIKAIDAHVGSSSGKRFADLAAEQQDALLKDIEGGKLQLADVDAKTFFKMLLMNTKEGMFSDPIYSGNRDMAGWKMLGFPGARYNYRDWVGRHGKRYDQPPVGIRGRPAWNGKG